MRGDTAVKKKKFVSKYQKPPVDILKSIPKSHYPSDVLGSYVGTPAKGEVPEQDADDL